MAPPTLAATQTVVFGSGEGVSATVDTFLQQSAPTANHAASTELNVDRDDPSGTGSHVQTLIRTTGLFGEGAGKVPANATILSATLELNVSNGGDPFALHRMLKDWNESSTWNTLVNGVQPDGVEAHTDPDHVTDWIDAGTVRLDVTASVKAWQADPAKNRGWVIFPTGNNGVDITSSEGSTAPRLIVKFGSSESRSVSFDRSAGYAGLRDTFVQANTPDASNASAAALNVDSDDPKGSGRDVQALLRFDQIFGTDSGEVPLDASVKTATLHLQVSNAGHPIALHRMLQNWSVSSTWNSLQGGVATDDVQARAVAEVTTQWVAMTNITLDVTESIKEWQRDPNSNFGWAVMPTNDNGVDFYASEGAVPPRLAVEISGSSVIEASADEPVAVSATVETAQVPSNGDAADDIAIWVNPANPGQSRIIGTEKQRGLAVYDLEGKQLQFLADGRMNNVDLRYNVPLGAVSADIVVASERNTNTLAVYKMDATTGMLTKVNTGNGIATSLKAYGLCLYKKPVTNEVYAFVTGTDGRVEQWLLQSDNSGLVNGTRVRSFDVGGITEGCVADDEHSYLYLAEEDVGIWRYSTEPDGGEARVAIDAVGSGGHLIADVEGLTLYRIRNGKGYLIASSQGNNTYVVYGRQPGNPYLGRFAIVPGGGIDGTEITDGIDVSNANLGSRFPSGVFVAQDTYNPAGNQNFKLVPWEVIAKGFSTPLTVEGGL